jgi:hypothetical protein
MVRCPEAGMAFAAAQSPQERAMDDPNKRNSPDSKRINVHEDHEVRYWTAALNVSPEELKKAVQAVGTMADDVRKYFGKKK